MTRGEAINDIFSMSEQAISVQNAEYVIKKIYDEFERKFEFIEQYKFADKCPDYKTVEQLDMFISARETDIKNIKLSIENAKQKIKNLEKKDGQIAITKEYTKV